MERQEYFRRLDVAYDVMDDDARRLQLKLFERAAQNHPRETTPAKGGVARAAPTKRTAKQ